MVHVAAFLASSEDEVAAGAEAGETTVVIADETEILGTGAKTLHLFETTVAGSVIETGGIVTEIVSGEGDAHHQDRGDHHLAGIFETVIFK